MNKRSDILLTSVASVAIGSLVPPLLGAFAVLGISGALFLICISLGLALLMFFVAAAPACIVFSTAMLVLGRLHLRSTWVKQPYKFWLLRFLLAGVLLGALAPLSLSWYPGSGQDIQEAMPRLVVASPIIGGVCALAVSGLWRKCARRQGEPNKTNA
jgi:hypothetical protein